MKLVRWVFVLGLLLAFVAYVWPTRWRYDHMSISGEDCPVRIDRINSHAEVLLPGDGWTPVEDAVDNSEDKPPTDTVS